MALLVIKIPTASLFSEAEYFHWIRIFHSLCLLIFKKPFSYAPILRTKREEGEGFSLKIQLFHKEYMLFYNEKINFSPKHPKHNLWSSLTSLKKCGTELAIFKFCPTKALFIVVKCTSLYYASMDIRQYRFIKGWNRQL